MGGIQNPPRGQKAHYKPYYSQILFPFSALPRVQLNGIYTAFFHGAAGRNDSACLQLGSEAGLVCYG